MKRFFALLLACVMMVSLFAGCGGSGGETDPNAGATEYKVAMITDYCDITDQSFNQTSYKALVASMFEGTLTVSNDTTVMPETGITVNTHANIK